MKNLLKIVSIIGLSVITQTAYSAEVTDTFTTGDTLTAAKINNIKSAVNDNDTRISNIVLTPGPAGADSTVAGPTGPAGAAGTVGGIGNTGAKGDTGAAGAQGATGANSTVAGPTGPAGLGVVVSSSAPTVNDDMNSPYSVGTVWIDTSAAKPYILVDNSANHAVWAFVLAGSATRYAIGDAGPAGGIVFHVTDGGLHGLEAATVDQERAEWGCVGTIISGAIGTVVGTGEQNTADIIAGCPGTIAASVAAAYGPGWYLPSKEELILLLSQSTDFYGGVLGGFASQGYWSSSQYDINTPWNLVLDLGQYVPSYWLYRFAPSGVRAVRSF
jgi:uncharacterized membrane protein YeaQ/YmgE (transglycosylase-associated protein family)